MYTIASRGQPTRPGEYGGQEYPMQTQQTRTATPARLRDGSWGARVEAAVGPGDVVTITTKAGRAWQATVQRVVWTDGRVALCATQSADRPAARNYDPQKFNGYGARRGGYVRACKTDGNCSSFGSGRSCGGHDCDGY